MSNDTPTPMQGNAQRYEAVLRISEALVECRQPEELAKTLADLLNEFLSFEHLDVLILKEGSAETEWHVWGKGGPPPGKDLPSENIPVQTLPRWPHSTQETLFIANWNTDERFPQVKQFMAEKGIKIGSVVRVPLTTPHRRLGTLGIASAPGVTYATEDIEFLRLVARNVAFAIDDGLNLRRAQAAQARLQFLLDLTNRITSNLQLREVLRAISVNIRDVIDCEGVGVTLTDRDSGEQRLYALDLPHGKGIAMEGLLLPNSAAAKEALGAMKPIVITAENIDSLGPQAREISIAEGVKNHCVIPIVNRGRVLGTLGIGRRTEIPFSLEDIDLLSQAAGQIGIAIENALAYEEISELKDKLAQEKLYLEDEIRSEMNFAEIVGNSPALRKVLKQVETVAPTDSTVLIYGETGTGKELIARAIHDLSPRKSKAFVKLNCAAIPTGLLESELFGHEKGAFTGAIAQRIGRFEVAHGGTIFLDEIGEIPLELQTKLLRVLQEREFERLGSSRTLRTDARLIAATNRDLEGMVDEQKFRSDLFFRLNVFPVHVPPLRERHGDIPLLVRHFAQQFAKRMNKVIDTIPSGTIEALCRYHWPGNIRELQNVIERAVIISMGAVLKVDVADLKLAKTSVPAVHRSSSASTRSSLENTLEETEREQILKALEQSHWVVAGPNGAAVKLGMKRSTLQLRMNKLGISRRSG